MPSKLYVGNLAYSVSNSDLEELFSTMGQVQSVAVITDKYTGPIQRLRLRRDDECGGCFQSHRAIQR